jgi:hypothetical protein
MFGGSKPGNRRHNVQLAQVCSRVLRLLEEGEVQVIVNVVGRDAKVGRGLIAAGLGVHVGGGLSCELLFVSCEGA